MMRLFLALALLWPISAQAYPCLVIKAMFAPFKKHGIAAAEKWAREHGYSEEEIRDAKQCLRR